jgi:hypothetical protein
MLEEVLSVGHCHWGENGLGSFSLDEWRVLGGSILVLLLEFGT